MCKGHPEKASHPIDQEPHERFEMMKRMTQVVIHRLQAARKQLLAGRP